MARKLVHFDGALNSHCLFTCCERPFTICKRASRTILGIGAGFIYRIEYLLDQV